MIIDERTGKPFSSEIGTAGFAAESDVKTGKYDHPFECKRMGKHTPCFMTKAECVSAYRHALANPPKHTWQVPCLECALVRVWEKEFKELDGVGEADFVDIEEPKKEREMGKKKETMAVAKGVHVPDLDDTVDQGVVLVRNGKPVSDDDLHESMEVSLPDHVMERLAALSVEEYRTPELQAAYMIHRMLDRAEEVGGQF